MTTYSVPRKGTIAARGPVPDNPRKDNWRSAPVAIVATFIVFILYSTVRAFAGNNFSTFEHEGQVFDWVRTNLVGQVHPHYWSPFYSPYIPLKFSYPFLHTQTGEGIAISASLYVLFIPLSFRLSCYYCRKAYYRAIFGDPSACAVKEKFARLNYQGETALPSKAFNFHRYALYLALLLVGFHWFHLYEAFHATGTDGKEHLYFGLGTLVIGFDTLALSAYVFSCHSFRHLIGGVLDRFSGSLSRYRFWSQVSHCNENHGNFFWISLISVGLADLYVCLLASGVFHDIGTILF